MIPLEDILSVVHADTAISDYARDVLDALEAYILHLRIPKAIYNVWVMEQDNALFSIFSVLTYEISTVDRFEQNILDTTRTYGHLLEVPYLITLLYTGGSYELIVPCDGTDDPPVYLVCEDDPTNTMIQHAASFSHFLYCWVWDYHMYYHEYLFSITKMQTEPDALQVRENFFQRFGNAVGPTYGAERYVYGYEFRRYQLGIHKLKISVQQSGSVFCCLSSLSKEELADDLQQHAALPVLANAIRESAEPKGVVLTTARMSLVDLS